MPRVLGLQLPPGAVLEGIAKPLTGVEATVRTGVACASRRAEPVTP